MSHMLKHESLIPKTPLCLPRKVLHDGFPSPRPLVVDQSPAGNFPIRGDHLFVYDASIPRIRGDRMLKVISFLKSVIREIRWGIVFSHRLFVVIIGYRGGVFLLIGTEFPCLIHLLQISGLSAAFPIIFVSFSLFYTVPCFSPLVRVFLPL